MMKKSHLSLAKSDPAAERSPFEEFGRRFEDMVHRPFSMTPWWARWAAPTEEVVAPAVDIYDEGGEIVMKAEIPGMKKEEIHVEIDNRNVTISGEKKKEEKTERKDYYRLERSYGSFVRTFTLPSELRTEKARASFKDGVLEIRVPKTADAASRSHQVKVE
jgi:HSP20 family protein